MPLYAYLDDVKKRFATGSAREHAYRPALQTLVETVLPDITALNDPAQIGCGAPDFILSRKKIDVGYIEAKDIGVGLDKVEKTEQLKRYLKSLENLILTDYLEFRFYRNGERVEQIRVGAIDGKSISTLPEQFERFQTLLVDFAAFQGQTIKSARKLAEMMAHKSRLMRDVFTKALKEERSSTLKDQLKAFQEVLVHDMNEEQFADVYAQTIAYGLFTARLHDESLSDFTRLEALALIPKSNPFLRQLFHYVAGPDLDDRVVWIVDALCDVYRATDLTEILKDFGSSTGRNDPLLHFYETFLAAYDPALRKSRGVWYTPEPVVNFIVRAIDDVLKEHFGLPDGLADKSKITIQVEGQETDGRTKSGKKLVDREVHKVQLLDVATGTGTFLAEVVRQIYSRFKGQEGIWSSYVESDLLPRLHGFELLMASYAMCHLKLDLLLHETGYAPSKPKDPPRLSVYLTNSLEEYHPDVGTLFASWLSKEANEASRIKKEMPIMVAFGNPPYFGESKNKGKWIMELLKTYKVEPGGGKLRERNSKWINDDYMKFIRLGEHYIEKNGEGVLAYITNHGYLDNPTFRGMRWHLLETFDDIYLVDLHGSLKKKETAPDGSPDQNIFDIEPGVAIIVAIKKKENRSNKILANVFHIDIRGKRPVKHDFLNNYDLRTVPWERLDCVEPFYFFVPKDLKTLSEYQAGFALNELFMSNSVGIVTARDSLTIHMNKENLLRTVHDFSSLPPEEARSKYDLGKDARDWKIHLAQKELLDTQLDSNNVCPIKYRLFDTRWTYFTGKSKGFHCMPRGEIMRFMLKDKNLALVVCRQIVSTSWRHVFLSSTLVDDSYVSNKSRERGYVMPLYRYESIMGGSEQRVPNLEPRIFQRIKDTVSDLTPGKLFDFVYGILWNPKYREKFNEFLKIDFPRIPYPSDPGTFHALAEKGEQLRLLHLMESPLLDDTTVTYPVSGDNIVDKLKFKDNQVWINKDQYFGNVSDIAWDFYIGGYQPAQKWLKDRKGRTLDVNDIQHYRRMIKALDETERIMQEVNEIDFLP